MENEHQNHLLIFSSDKKKERDTKNKYKIKRKWNQKKITYGFFFIRT